VGIGGIGMSALACLLLDRKVDVSGSDLSESYVTAMLTKAGAKVYIGHDEKHLPAGATLVYATGVSDKNPEYRAALASGAQVLHRSDLLMHIAAGYQLLAVTGTHGKTTTAALLSHLLLSAGADPAFAVGGLITQYGRNGAAGGGAHFVIEACESDGTFLKYHPFGAIVTNIDSDHIDYFGSEQALHAAFYQFFDTVASPAHLFWCGDDPHLRSYSPPGISYGFGEQCALRLTNFSQEGWQISFDIEGKAGSYRQVTLPLIGRHNALNGAAVFACGLKLGLHEATIRSAFNTFKGIKRRCECTGAHQQTLFIDDYAHHPAEIKTTLEGVRAAIGPNRRLVAIYQPHRYTRTRDCMGLFAAAFDAASVVIITEIYAAGEAPLDGLSDAMVVQDIALATKVPMHFVARGTLIDWLLTFVQDGDLVITLGAGDITYVTKELLKQFP
jgi:UDP-N-acetylmuramate--alanine ligase